MKDTEYVTTLKLNKQLVNVGLDDNGQCYFVEYVDPKTDEDKQVSLGTYNTDYKYAAEELLGEPIIDCPYYNLTKAKDENCEHKHEFGFCHKCWFEDMNWHMRQNLILKHFIDRRLNINPKYKELFEQILEAYKEGGEYQE